jgi:hypothetical protein
MYVVTIVSDSATMSCWLRAIVVVSVLAMQCGAYMDRIERELLRTRVSNMFDWSYDAYVRHAYPQDELLVRLTRFRIGFQRNDTLHCDLYASRCRVLAIRRGSARR